MHITIVGISTQFIHCVLYFEVVCHETSVEGVTLAHNSIWNELDHFRIEMECLVSFQGRQYSDIYLAKFYFMRGCGWFNTAIVASFARLFEFECFSERARDAVNLSPFFNLLD